MPTNSHYLMARSFLTSLDPRTKFVCLLLASANILFAQSSSALMSSAAILIAGIVASPISFHHFIKQLRRVAWFTLFLMLIHTFSDSGTILFELGGFYATAEGLLEGLFLSAKISLLLVCSYIFVATTRVDEMLDAVEATTDRWQSSGSFVLIFSTTLNFVPLLIRSAQQIKSAQIARGADVDSSFIKQIRFASSAALPLFVSAFRASHHLAEAIDARGFGATSLRSPFNTRALQPKDWFMFTSLAVVVLLTMYLNFVAAQS